MPPLFVVGPEGDTSELVNYRVRGNYMIVDRLFAAAAELRFGAGNRSGPHRPHRWEAGIVSDERDPRSEAERKPDGAPQPEAVDENDDRPLTGELAPMRLRPEPPRVTRLSRKVLAGLGLAASLGVGGAWSMRSRPGTAAIRAGTLFHRQPLDTDGLAGLPKDYTGVPKLGPPLPAISAARSSTHRTEAICSTPGGTAPPPSRPQPGGAPDAGTRRLAPRACSRPRRRSPPIPRRPHSHPRRLPRNRSRQPRSRTAASHTVGAGSAARLPQPGARQAHRLARSGRSARLGNVLQAGAVISAALITGIRSDLPDRSPRR
jgi:type IV secretion system protein VirB10